MSNKTKEAVLEIVFAVLEKTLPETAYAEAMRKINREVDEKIPDNSIRYFRVIFSWTRRPKLQLAPVGSKQMMEQGNSDVLLTTTDGKFLNHVVVVAMLMKDGGFTSVNLGPIMELSVEDAEEWMRHPVKPVDEKKEEGKQ